MKNSKELRMKELKQEYAHICAALQSILKN